MLVVTAKADNVRVARWCCAVTNSIHELVVRVRDTCPGAQVLVRDLSVDLDALIDVSGRDGRLLAAAARLGPLAGLAAEALHEVGDRQHGHGRSLRSLGLGDRWSRGWVSRT